MNGELNTEEDMINIHFITNFDELEPLLDKAKVLIKSLREALEDIAKFDLTIKNAEA